MPIRTTDKLNKDILLELARDSSQSAKILSEKLGVTRQTIAARIAQLEKSGFVKGYKAKIDYAALGYGTFFILFLKIGSFDEALLQKALEDFRASPHVVMDASVTGEWDVVQVLAFKSTQEYDDYIARIRTKYGRTFRDSKSHAILKIFKSADEWVPEP